MAAKSIWNGLKFLWSLGAKAKELIATIRNNWPIIKQAFGIWAQGTAEECFLLFFTTPSTQANPGAPSTIPGGKSFAPGGGTRRASVPSTVGGEGLNVSTSKDKFGNATIRIANTGMAYNAGIANFA